jgi:RNA polymerase sigma factor (TIGR02999 family)
LVGTEDPSWESRAHFFAAAAEAMRRVLIDRARRRQADRRGGRWRRVALETIDAPAQADEDVLLGVHGALEALALEDARAAELVKLRFFAGLGVEEAALALGVTDRTARRYWRFARAWLYERLGREGG